MKPSELHIGMWVWSVKFDRPVQIELSDFVELEKLCNGGELTEEIIAMMFIKPMPPEEVSEMVAQHVRLSQKIRINLD